MDRFPVPDGPEIRNNHKQIMNRFKTLKARLQVSFGFAAVAALVYGASLALVNGADDPKEAKTEAVAKADAKPAKKTAKKFTGAELYQMHCNRCHPERYPTEFTSAQWKTLVTHMRVRANLPASQAKEILKYLQEESGN